MYINYECNWHWSRRVRHRGRVTTDFPVLAEFWPVPPLVVITAPLPAILPASGGTTAEHARQTTYLLPVILRFA